VFGPQWTTPRPPRAAASRPVRGWRVAIGLVLALVGHALAVGAAWLGRAATGWGTGLLAGAALVSAACVGVGLVSVVRGDRGVGIGLLAGWAGWPVVLAVLGVLVLYVLDGAPG
jgi:hypothetical protein